MKISSLYNLLANNSYPGRGIVVGKTPDGTKAAVAYFIMGRSANSRNRIFVKDGDGLRTQAFDESKVEDSSLIIYSPLKVLGRKTIITNGDQTDTIYDEMKNGKTFEESLRSRYFEPDDPNFTPRISALVDIEDKLSFSFYILKSNDGDSSSCQRFTYSYENPKNGEGFFIHTYVGDGNPLISFDGEPEKITIPDDIDEFTNKVWDSLNESNKISLFIRYIDIVTGKYDSRIVNKNK